MLTFDPDERFSADQCLQSPIFDSLRKPQDAKSKYVVEINDIEI